MSELTDKQIPPVLDFKTDVVFFDCEVTKLAVGGSVFCVGFRSLDASGEEINEVIDSREPRARERIKERLREIEQSGRLLVGYNSNLYDLPLLVKLLGDPQADPKTISDELISHGYWDRRDANGYRINPEKVWGSLINPGHTLDLVSRIKSEKEDESSTGFTRLKMIGAIFGFGSVQDLPYSPDDSLTEKQWDETKRYCINDLKLTEFVFSKYRETYEAIWSLSCEVGVNLLRFTNAQLTERYFKLRYQSKVGKPAERYSENNWPGRVKLPISKRIPELTNNEAKDWERHVRQTEYKSRDLGLDKDDPAYLATYRTLNFDGFRIAVGFGGVHSIHKTESGEPLPAVVVSDENWQAVYADVASYYPFLLLANRIPLGLMGDHGLEIFQDVVNRRLEMKRRSKDKSLSDEERKSAKIADEALKILINATYGKTGDKWSVLNSPGSNNAVTMSGQLGFCSLIERLQAIGCVILSANTDGIFLKAPKSRLEDCKSVMGSWEAAMGCRLEIEPKRAVVIKDSNNWIAENPDGTLEGKGSYRLVSRATHDKHDPAIVPIALFKALVEGKPPEVTIRNHLENNRFGDFVFCGKGSGSTLSKGDIVQRIKTIRGYAAFKSSGWELLTKSGKESTQLPDFVGLQLTLNLNAPIPRDLNPYWYVGEVRDALKPFGFKWDPEDLTGAARRLWDKWKLVASPAVGKMTSRGLSPTGAALSLVDWETTPTLKIFTGSKPGLVADATPILVLDIDKPELWRDWIGSDPERLGSLETLIESDPLTVTKGCTAEDVRRGFARGKLIFRLSNRDHRLYSKFQKKTYEKITLTTGAELFNGFGTVSALGDATGGLRYELIGELGELPDWLEKSLIEIVGKGSPKTPSKSFQKGRAQQAEAVANTVVEQTEALEHSEAEQTREPNWDVVFQRLGEEFDKRFADHPFEAQRRNVERMDGTIDRRFAARMRCPGGREAHSSRKSNHKEAELFLDNATGFPVFLCKHSSCQFQKSFDEWKISQCGNITISIGGRAIKSDVIQPRWTPILKTNDPQESVGGEHIGEIIHSTRGIKLIKAAVGAGKTHGSAQAAIQAAKAGRKTYFVTTSINLATEFVGKVKTLDPTMADRVAVGRDQLGTKYDNGEDVATINEVIGVSDGTIYDELKFEEKILIRAICHESLNRRKFSKYLRTTWDRIQREIANGEKPLIIIDEFDSFVDTLEQRFKLAVRYRNQANRSYGQFFTLALEDCPANRYSSNKGYLSCEDCHKFNATGSLVTDLGFKTVSLRNPAFKVRRAEDDPIELAGDPIVRLDLQDFELGETVWVEGRVKYQPILGYAGKSLGRDRRESLPRLAYQGDFVESQRETRNNVNEVWDHILGSLIFPSVKTHYPLNQSGEIMSREDVMEIKQYKRADVVDYPLRTCDAPYVSGIDSIPLLMIRDVVDKGADAVLMSATLSDTVQAVVRETLGDIKPVEVESRNKPIAELMVVCVHNADDLPIRLFDINPNWLGVLKANGWHDSLGKFLFFVPSVKQLEKVRDNPLWKKERTGFDFGIASGSGQEFGIKTGTTTHGEILGTVGSRFQPIGRGFDGLDVTLLVVDTRTNRLAADLIIRDPQDGETLQDIVTIAATQELAIRNGQNVGRPLRGGEDKRAVLVLLNTSEDQAQAILAGIQAEKRVQTIHYQTYCFVSQAIFNDSELWLAGEKVWINTEGFDNPNVSKAKKRKIDKATAKLKSDKERVEKLTKLAKEAVENGVPKGTFYREHYITRLAKSLPGLQRQLKLIFGEDG